MINERRVGTVTRRRWAEYPSRINGLALRSSKGKGCGKGESSVIADALAGWFPVALRFRPTPSVTWMGRDPTLLRASFFDQAVAQLERTEPPQPTRGSSIDLLLQVAAGLRRSEPLGLIFDLSRCGSIFLTDALRAMWEMTVIADAMPVSSLFLPYGYAISPFAVGRWPAVQRALLESLANIYGQNGRLVIKFSSWNILAWPLIRSIWPDARCAIIIRGLVDIVAANLVMGSDWVRWRTQSPLIPMELFNWLGLNVTTMPKAEYCARAVGLFCAAGAAMFDSRCRIFNFETISAGEIGRLAAFLGVGRPPTWEQTIDECVNAWQLARERMVPRLSPVLDLARQASDRWARPSYEQLMGDVIPNV